MRPRPGGLEVQTADDLDEIGAEWDELVDASGANPFQRSWWLRSTRVGAARIALVRDPGGALVGGLALERVIRGVAQLRMIGEELGAADLDLLTVDGMGEPVAEALKAWLLRRPGPVRHRFAGLRSGAALVGLVPNGTSRVEGVALSEPVPTDLEDWLATRSANLRKDVRRLRRRFEQLGAEAVMLDADQVPAALARFHQLHRHVYAGRSALAADRFDRAVLAGVDAGEVALHAVRAGDQLAAVEVMLLHGPRLGLLASAADRTTPELVGAGNLLNLHAFAYAAEHGYSEVDFLRGDSAHKRRWVGSARDVVTATGHTGTVAKVAGDAPGVLRRARSRLRPRG